MKEPLVLNLIDVSAWIIRGPEGPSYQGVLPKRMKFFHVSVAPGLRLILIDSNGNICISDGYRDPIASLLARETKAGVQRPGYSGHNFGLSIDLDVEQTLRRMSLTYDALLDWMATRGWYCHRRDRQRGMEDWHFNYFGPNHEAHNASAVQAWIIQNYGPFISGDEAWVQERLFATSFYHGEIDGKFGPLSRKALSAFEAAYDLPTDGVIDDMSCRTLAIVTAQKQITVAQPLLAPMA